MNVFGYNRDVNNGADWHVGQSYFINGMGAVDETEVPMPSTYINNNSQIDISDIQNKNVKTTVYDTVMFSSNGSTIEQVKTKIKEHITNYGAVFAGIHGPQADSNHCNFNTGAIYCNGITACCARDKKGCEVNHAVAIIGWNDDYSKDNFNPNNKPTNNGAWIIKNSWGERKEYGTVDEVKTKIFNKDTTYWSNKNVTNSSQITDEQIKEYLLTKNNLNVTIENNKVYLIIGDNGIMYVSYEDINVYSQLAGIQKATDTKDYDYIYQYDETTPLGEVTPKDNISKIYLANVFTKQSTKTEYLTRSWSKCSRNLYM